MYKRQMGTMVVAMQKGIARGIFSNEAGLGSAPIAAAAAVTKEPVRQGLVSMTGTFIDTIIICTMTGISVVLAGTWNDPNLEGVEITMAAFQKGLPFAPVVASFILMLCLVFFAFTTILGWNYYCLLYTSAVLTTLKNVGPGISQVGPVENFFEFSWLSKLVFLSLIHI